MAQVATRSWFLAGFAHLAAAALMALVAAAPSKLFPAPLHFVLGMVGVFLVGSALAYGFASPFTKREAFALWPSQAALGLVLAADGLIVVTSIIHGDTMRAATLLFGAAFVLVPLDLLVTALVGREWRDGIAIYAKDQPFRLDDIMAATCFAVSMGALAVAGGLLVWVPRRLVVPGMVLFALGYALPFFTGVLLFLLPRNAKRPLHGVVLIGAALVIEMLAAIALTLGFLVAGSDLRFSGGGVLLAILLAGAAFLRITFPRPLGAQVRRALPLLRAAGALAVIAGLALPLSLAGGTPGTLFAPAAYAMLVLCAVLAVTGTLLAAPILLNSVPREGAWAKWAGVLAIAGLFLVGPAFQYARSPFPGAVVLAVSTVVVIWGVAPMRTPRRDCNVE